MSYILTQLIIEGLNSKMLDKHIYTDMTVILIILLFASCHMIYANNSDNNTPQAKKRELCVSGFLSNLI